MSFEEAVHVFTIQQQAMIQKNIEVRQTDTSSSLFYLPRHTSATSSRLVLTHIWAMFSQIDGELMAFTTRYASSSLPAKGENEEQG